MPPDQEYLTVQQVIAVLPLSRAMVYRLLADGRLPSYRVGRRRLVAKEDLDRYMATCRQESTRQK